MKESDVKTRFRALPQNPPEEVIEQTALELEMLNFSPTLLIDFPGFTRCTREDAEKEALRVLALEPAQLPAYDSRSFSGPGDFREKQADLLYYFYELLTRLRNGEPEAWDYIHELYEDD